MSVHIRRVPVLNDNYTFLIHNSDSKVTIAIDPSEGVPVENALKNEGWLLTHILVTHHHWDHVGGIQHLKDQYNCEVGCSAFDLNRVSGAQHGFRHAQWIDYGGMPIQCLMIPGHTLGHMAYWLPNAGSVFCGDTLFGFGCGRLFEGTASDLFESLTLLRNLEGLKLIYCGHEYTYRNLEFCRSVFPHDAVIQTAFQKSRPHEPTVPLEAPAEFSRNPFFRCHETSIQQTLGYKADDTDPREVFRTLRRLRDEF